MTYAEAVARARAKAFPTPIVVIRMTAEQFDAATLAGSQAERDWLATGVKTGQLVVSDSAKEDTSTVTTTMDLPTTEGDSNA